MAIDKRITEMTELTTPQPNDELAIVDQLNPTATRKVKMSTLDSRFINTDGDTMDGDLIMEGRLMLPMGEISYFSLTGTSINITAQSDGSTNMVVAPVVTTLANDMEFDNGGGNNGRLRYIGATTKTFHVACSISFGGGNGATFVIGIARDGTVIGASKIIRKVSAGGDIGSTAMHLMVTLATNQYLEVFIGNTTNTDDPTIHTLNLFAMGM